jgi:hypothetical protein
MEGAFCGACGAKAGEAQAPPSVQNLQAGAPASAPVKGSNTALKIVFVVVGILAVLGILGGVGLYWAASKVKNKVQEVAGMSGVDLEKLASQGSGSSSEGGDGCWLLPREEAERLAGLTILRAAPNPDADSSKLSCQYFADPDELRKASQAQADEAMKAMKRSDSSGPEAGVQQMEKFTKGLIGSAAAGEAGNGLVLELAVRKSGGGSDWAGVSIASKAMGMMQPVPGLGDKALMAPMAMSIYALKGDSFLELTMPGLPAGREKGIPIARAILGRL